MIWKQPVLGIDTSNYKTSLALVCRDEEVVKIIRDIRKPLKVKDGELGLRQSTAVFQHMENIPSMLQEIFSLCPGREIKAVAVSSRPRSVDGSYMPVFRAGESFAQTISQSLGLPLYRFSHQDGHVEGARLGTSLEKSEEFLSFHLSGGTLELLVYNQGNLKEIGGTKDISFGQVFDRIGVYLGKSFPAGEALDSMAITAKGETEILKDIPLDGLYVNLSGIETQSKRCIDSGIKDIDSLIREVFNKTIKVLYKMSLKAAEETGISAVLFAGGVSSSFYIRQELGNKLKKAGIEPVFAENNLSSDNAVGIGILGGKNIWQ